MALDVMERREFRTEENMIVIQADDLAKGLANIRETLTGLGGSALRIGAKAAAMTEAGRTEDAAKWGSLAADIEASVLHITNINHIAAAVEGIKALANNHASLQGITVVDSNGDPIPPA